MSDDLDYLDNENDHGTGDGDGEPQSDSQGKAPSWRRRLEKDRDTFRTERDTLARENAFLKAGIDPEDGKAKWLVKGYDGELTVDAIKLAAIEAGVLDAPQGEGEGDGGIPPAERAAHERIASTSTGSRDTGAFDFDSAIAEARSARNHQRVIELKQAQAAASNRR